MLSLFAANLAFFTISFRVLDALNRGTFMVGIFIFFSVWGLTPARAFLWSTLKVPRPDTWMEPVFFLREPCTAPTNASRAAAAAFLVIPASFAMRSTRSDLTISLPPWNSYRNGKRDGL